MDQNFDVVVDDECNDMEELRCDVEADDDEQDPEMVDCPTCGHSTHISEGKCSGSGCNYVFEFTKSGHLMDGFVVDEDCVDYDGSSSDEEEEEEDELSSDSETSTVVSDEGNDAWLDDKDESWEPSDKDNFETTPTRRSKRVCRRNYYESDEEDE